MLERFRLRLADADALPQLAILGLLAGIVAGVIILAFRGLITLLQSLYLDPQLRLDYAELSPLAHFLLPVAGAFLIGLIFHYLPKAMRRVGVIHVMERLSYHQGYLPPHNLLLQFFGAAISIASGHSVGREGPSIHLGAAGGSLIGQWLTLPNNSIRTLVACGVAAAIAASFNTPLAGVIFAMEVVMMEYTISSFTPVILAAVSATVITRLVYGSAPAFAVPALQMGSIAELPFVLLTGVVIGTLAALFIHLLLFFTKRTSDWPLWPRITLAGVITGLCAVMVPRIMGVGYETVNDALLGQLPLWIMLSVLLVKLLATTVGLGLGLPGGLIGPTLVIGALAGGTIGYIANQILPGDLTSHGFYAMLGMGAMMGATLQAPLAALMALLELTANPNILLPGMLAIITAGLISSQLFSKSSVYLMLMQAAGLDYRNSPVDQSLRRIGVTSAMERSFITQPRNVPRGELETILKQEPRWILVEDKGERQSLLLAADLARFLQENEMEEIDLLAIPATRYDAAPLSLQATLLEAQEQLNASQAEALYVIRPNWPEGRVYGVLTRQHIEERYRYNR